jgi:hypothetical protein
VIFFAAHQRTSGCPDETRTPTNGSSSQEIHHASAKSLAHRHLDMVVANTSAAGPVKRVSSHQKV